MAHQDLSKRPVLIEANAGEEPPDKKQKTNLLPPSLELAQAMLSLRRRPFVSSPSPTLFPTACNIEKIRKRDVVSIDSLTAISDDEGDTPMNYCNHAARREGTTDFQRSTIYGLSIAPVPIGRPLAAAPSLPRYAPGQVAPTKTAVRK